MRECYECGSLADKLSPRSRCVMCEHRRAELNERENEEVRKEFNRMLKERNHWKRKCEELQRRDGGPFQGIFK